MPAVFLNPNLSTTHNSLTQITRHPWERVMIVKQNNETIKCFANSKNSVIPQLQQSNLEPEMPSFTQHSLTTQCRNPPHLVLNTVLQITQCLTNQIITVIIHIAIFHYCGPLIFLEILFNSHVL